VRGIAVFWIAICVLVILAGGLALAYLGFMTYASRRMSSPAAARMARSQKAVRAAEAAIQAELARIKAAGQPVSATQIAPASVARAENAAVLYERAFAATKLTQHDRSALRSFLFPLPGSSRDHLVNPARTIIARNRTALDLTYKATARPRCRFPVKWEEGAAVLFPHLSKMRDLCRLMSAQAVLLSIDGDVPRALQAIQAGIALADALAAEPAEASQVVRYRLYQMALEALQVVMWAHLVPPDGCRTLYDRLAAIQITGPFVRAAIADRAAAVTVYHIAQSNPAALGIRLSPAQSTVLPPAWTVNAAEWLPLLSRRIGLVDQPYRAARAQLAALDDDGRKMEANNADPVAQMLFLDSDGWASSWWRQRDMAIARIGLAEAALAAKACRARTGAYPDSLTLLRSAVGWQIPQDPFSGRDFVYKRNGEAVVIYSVGPDLRDNGGAPMRQPSGAETRQWRGDIVWRLSK
jgi:hypothetical protein